MKIPNPITKGEKIMKKHFLAIILLGMSWPIMAANGDNPGTPFQTIQEGLDRNFQATQDIPDTVVQNITEILPKAPSAAARRWISPYWMSRGSYTNYDDIGTRNETTTTEIFIFNPSTYDTVLATVSAYSPDGSIFNGGEWGTDLPVTVSIPPFGQAHVYISDNYNFKHNYNHTGAVIIEADGPVLPDGQITTSNHFSDPGSEQKRMGLQVRTMTWYPDHSENNQGQQDTVQAP